MIGGFMSSMNPAFAALNALKAIRTTIVIVSGLAFAGALLHSCNKILGDVRSAAAAEREIEHLAAVAQANEHFQETRLDVQAEFRKMDKQHRTEIDRLKSRLREMPEPVQAPEGATACPVDCIL